MNAFVTRIGPIRLVCTIRSICSSVTPSSGPAIPYPALLKTTSTSPRGKVSRSQPRSICCGSVMSSAKQDKRWEAPQALSPSTDFRMVATTCPAPRCEQLHEARPSPEEDR